MGDTNNKRKRSRISLVLDSDPNIKYSVKIDDTKAAFCWKFFGIALKNDEIFDDKHYYCKLCFPQKVEPRYATTTSTSNLNTHLQVTHNIQTSSLSSATRRTANILDGNTVNVNKKAQLSRQIALWLSRDLRPFSTVTSEGFQDFALATGIVDRIEELPSDRALSGSALNDIYLLVEDAFKKQINSIKRPFTVMADLWTDSSCNVPYINVSIQYMDDNLKLHVLHVTTEDLTRPHTGERIGSFIKSKLNELGLTGPFYYVTDGGRNMLASVRYMPMCIHRFNCVAHSINLAISSDLSSLSTWKDLVIPTINLLKRTHGALAYKMQELKVLFQEQQAKEIFEYLDECETTLIDQIGADEDIIDDTNNVLRECFNEQLDLLNNFNMFKTSIVTRWNTNLVMINSYLRNASSINSCLAHLNKRELILTQDQYETVVELQAFFNCFESTLKVLQSSSEPTSHMLILFQNSIIKKLRVLASHNSALTDVYLMAIQSIEQRMSMEDEWIVAALLDPGQIKSNLVFTQLEKKNTTLKELLLRFMQQANPEANPNISDSSINSIQEQDVQNFGPAKRLRYEMLRELDSEESSDSVLDRSIDNEIDRYLLIASSYSNFGDVLEFWMQNKINLPHLFNLACNILGLSLTSSFCEHAFSISGTLLNKKRSKLNPVRAHKQLFINANYKFYTSQRN